jgi:predicted nucleic acid-binding protein
VDKTAVVNASPLIFLSRAGKLFLLHELAERILVPSPVAEEIAARGTGDITVKAIQDAPWVEVVSPPPIPEEIASWGLGPGESSVLAVAIASLGTVAVLDDLNGRKCAECLEIPVRGTFGIAWQPMP